MEDNKTLVFVHIHKTAGSTVRHALKKMFPSFFIIDSMNPVKSFNEFENLTIEQRNSIQTVFGHYVLEILPLINNPVTFSYFRDPIDQFLSYYYYIKKSKWNYYHELANKYNVIDFAHKTQELGFDNMQTRHLSHHVEHLIDHNTALNKIEIDEVIYNKAWEQLNNLDYVFLTSQIDLSLIIFKDLFKLKRSPYYQSYNITKNRKHKDEISQADRNIIKNIQKWDIKLFEEVKAINQKLLENNQSFIKEAERFTIENLDYNKRNKLLFSYEKYMDKLRRKLRY